MATVRAADRTANGWPGPASSLAAVGDHVRRLRGQRCRDRGPRRGQARRACRGSVRPGSSILRSARRQARQAARSARQQRTGCPARLDGVLHQAAPGWHVARQQARQDVAAARIAFGHDRRGRPGQRQRDRPRSSHPASRPRRPVRRGSPIQEPRFVTMSANWPVDTCSATAAPLASLTSRSTTSRPSESGTTFTASTTAGHGRGQRPVIRLTSRSDPGRPALPRSST